MIDLEVNRMKYNIEIMVSVLFCNTVFAQRFKVTLLAARLAMYLLAILTKLQGDSEILIITSILPI